MGSSRAAASSGPCGTEARTAADSKPHDSVRNRVPLADRRAVEGIAFAVRLGIDVPCAIPSLERGRHLSPAIREARRVLRRRVRVEWEWASLDSAIVKAPKGGDATGPNPTDRGKSGVKRHILTDGRGVPLAAEISAANVHDKRAAISTVDAIVMRAPRGPRRPTTLCLDKGYDFDDVEREIRARGIRPHIRRRGEPPRSCRRGRARRWVVERTNAWHNRFRALLIRWERRGTNYLALLHLACAMIALRHTM